jgi:cytochrome c oxidase subunit 2
VGPTWVGLAGSERELQDGTTVVADDAYLVRAIAEPGADLLADYRLQMPQNRLTGDDIADVIAYIKDLSQPVGG